MICSPTGIAARRRRRISLAEVEQPAGDESRGPVGKDAAQPRGEIGDRHRSSGASARAVGGRGSRSRAGAPIRGTASARRPRAGRAAAPTAAGRRTRSRRRCRCHRRSRARRDPVAVRSSSRTRERSSGQPGSLRQSPRCIGEVGLGLRRAGGRRPGSAGRSSTPLGSSLSQRPNQRISSGTRSRCGPGSDVAVDMCAHGPQQQPLRALEVLERAERVVAIAVGPAARRASSRTRSGRSPPRSRRGGWRCGPSPAASTARPAAPRTNGGARGQTPRTAPPSGHANAGRRARAPVGAPRARPCRGRSRSRRSPCSAPP